jgi:hypothetical protein
MAYFVGLYECPDVGLIRAGTINYFLFFELFFVDVCSSHTSSMAS